MFEIGDLTTCPPDCIVCASTSKAERMDYKCLGCGSAHGEPTDNSSENWYWRIVENGRIGPFCTELCSKEFRLVTEAAFSLNEWERLHFLKWRMLNGELQDPRRDNRQMAS
jgi:hypothetical protein